MIASIKIARTYNCDVIYAHANYWLETVFTAYFTSLITGKNLYAGVLDRFKEDEDGLRSVDLLRTMISKRQFRALFFALIRRASVKRANACIVPNSTVAEYARSTLRARNAIAIGRGVSELFFGRENEKVQYEACYVGRISEGKGITQLLRAWGEVVKRRPLALLAIAGSADQQVEAQAGAEKLVSQLGISANVRFLGYLNDASLVHKLHLSSKMFVFPSRREGFARAVAEAMASGIPCIVSDLPELKEVYADAAIYVPQNDHQYLAFAILKLLEDDLTREESGRRASLYVKCYSWGSVAERFSTAVNANVGEQKVKKG